MYGFKEIEIYKKVANVYPNVVMHAILLNKHVE